MKEAVNHPDHYMDSSKVECIDIIEHMFFCSGNAFKYLYRAGAKDETEQELRKAIWYLNRACVKKEINVLPFHIKGLVNKVADTRHEYIGDAMQAIYYGEWQQAIVYVISYIDYINRINK